MLFRVSRIPYWCMAVVVALTWAADSAVCSNDPGNPKQEAAVELAASDEAGSSSADTPNCAKIQDWGECTFDKIPKRPSYLDNACKDTLDKLALRLLEVPNGKLDVVGYVDKSETGTPALAAQRSVNVKYYLTTAGPTRVDPNRVGARTGGTKDKSAHFYFVSENLCSGQVEEGTAVNESKVHPSK